MTSSFTTYAEIKGEDVFVKDISRYKSAINNLQDGLYELTVKFVYDPKTHPQLKYYFGVIVKTLQRLFKEENKEFKSIHECHKLLEANCSQYETELNNIVITKVLYVVDMNIPEMIYYIEKCRFFLLDVFNTDTPDPDPKWKDKIL